MKQSSIRQDIQFLRGIAVLAVLIYHSEIIPFSGGYLGVDIFFVISGYLITSIILRDLAAHRFSFIHFYTRRAKRLLPAAYCTLIFSTLLSFKILTSAQWSDFIKQLIGTVTFTANLVLPFQTGYFETTAEGKPLLHTWSLSVEEQYYLCIPLLLYLIRPKWHFTALTITTLISLLTCISFVSFPFTYWRFPSIDSQTAAFFMLPTRAWEMLVGSLLAWIVINNYNIKQLNIVKFLAFILICYLCVFPLNSFHPRENAVLVVMATAILIAGKNDWLPQNKLIQSIEKIGDWSYSLYLIHWPLFALSRNAYLGETPTHIKFILLFISIILAYLQYEYVEQRFRYGWQANKIKTFKWLATTSVLVIFVPISADFIRDHNHSANFDYLSQPNYGLNNVCAAGKTFTHQIECRTAEQPIYAVWGDSYTMHLIPGLKLEKPIGESLIQITKAACAPILGIASIDSNYNETWAKGCLEFNENAISFIQKNESIKYVLMSSPYAGYFDYGNVSLFYGGKKLIGDRSIALEQMVTTIKKLLSYGKHPILIAPPPKAGFNIGECWERKNKDLLVLGRSDCNFQIEEYYAFQRGIIDGINEVHRRTNVEVAWFDNVICKNGHCKTLLSDGTSIYKDGGHLTVEGSEWAVPLLHLADLIDNASTQP